MARSYVPPSEPTLRRTLQAVDVDLVDQELGVWLEKKAPGTAVAVDGKTVQGAVDQNGRRLRLVSALVHKEGVVVGQRLVPPEQPRPFYILAGLAAPFAINDQT